MQTEQPPQSIRTLAREGVSAFEQKKSRFVGYAAPVGDEAQALGYARSVQEREPGASAVLHAYVCGLHGQTVRYYDSHEPSGGLLILEALKRAQVTGAVVAVARYFGGMLLGAGPLGRAFGLAAAQAVARAEPCQAHLTTLVRVDVPYALSGKLENWLTNSGYRLERLEYGEQVTATIQARNTHLEALGAALADLTQGRAIPELLGEHYMHWQ